MMKLFQYHSGDKDPSCEVHPVLSHITALSHKLSVAAVDLLERWRQREPPVGEAHLPEHIRVPEALRHVLVT